MLNASELNACVIISRVFTLSVTIMLATSLSALQWVSLSLRTCSSYGRLKL